MRNSAAWPAIIYLASLLRLERKCSIRYIVPETCYPSIVKLIMLGWTVSIDYDTSTNITIKAKLTPLLYTEHLSPVLNAYSGLEVSSIHLSKQTTSWQ